MASMDLRPVVLEGETLRLEPLEARHAPGLATAIDDETFVHFPPPFCPTGDARTSAEAFIASRIWVGPGSGGGGGLGYALVLREGGRVAGASCFLDVRPMHRGLEIGATFIARDLRGSRVNPEAKLLMLTHAFETLGCVRVQLKCDARNAASAAAIAKLGATPEGVLRRHMVMRDGFVRDTLMFSVTDEDWHRVRGALRARLGYARPA